MKKQQGTKSPRSQRPLRAVNGEELENIVGGAAGADKPSPQLVSNFN